MEEEKRALVAQDNQFPAEQKRDMAMTINELVGESMLIQEVMKRVMKDGEHYGVIPGTNGKPSLLKPGAEKLARTFRMAPKYQIQERDLGNGHREYRIITSLYNINTGDFWGEGVGICTTMEKKYRYRTGPVTDTGRPVPQAYWTLRKENPGKALDMIGGKGFSTAKGEDGSWRVVVKGEPVEHDNPADYYNTVLKIGKKRSLVDAVLTATSASDIFTQDVEDMDLADLNPAPAKPAPKPEAQSCPSRPSPPVPREPERQPDPIMATPASGKIPFPPGGGAVSEARSRRFWAIAKGAGLDDAKIKVFMERMTGVASTSGLSKDNYEVLCDLVAKPEERWTVNGSDPDMDTIEADLDAQFSAKQVEVQEELF
jgi:hypothetical protein